MIADNNRCELMLSREERLTLGEIVIPLGILLFLLPGSECLLHSFEIGDRPRDRLSVASCHNNFARDNEKFGMLSQVTREAAFVAKSEMGLISFLRNRNRQVVSSRTPASETR